MISTGQAQFVNAMGDLLATWNLPRATGRFYGDLLLRGEAASSEQLRTDLSLSSGAVSTAIRELVSWGLARTIPQPGSRQLLVQAAVGFEQLLTASHERTRALVCTLRAAEEMTENTHAASRVRDVTNLFISSVDAGEHVLRKHSRSWTTSQAPHKQRLFHRGNTNYVAAKRFSTVKLGADIFRRHVTISRLRDR